MNPSLSFSESFKSANLGEMVALPNLASDQTKAANAKSLSVEAELIIEHSCSTLNRLVAYAIEQKTGADFIEARKMVFPQYFNVALGLTYLISAVVPPQVLEVMNSNSFSEIEAGFRDDGLVAFGAEVRDQGIFTAWMLRKISDICQRINKAAVHESIKEDNAGILREYQHMAMLTRFSLDCLFLSMRRSKPIYPEVMPFVM